MNYTIIIDFFKTFGWQLFLLALSGIIVLGCLKWFGCFKKLNSLYKKYVYFGLSCLFSIVACTIYLLITHNFVWTTYLALCLSVIGLTIVVYSLYEHIGLRTVWKKVLNLISKTFKRIVTSIVNGSLNSAKRKEIAVGLGSEILTELIALAKEKEQLEVAEPKDEIQTETN